MTQAPLDELHFLTEALRAHAEWSKSCGAQALPRCDEEWLAMRREHYRNTPYNDDIEDAQGGMPSEASIAASSPLMTETPTPTHDDDSNRERRATTAASVAPRPVADNGPLPANAQIPKAPERHAPTKPGASTEPVIAAPQRDEATTPLPAVLSAEERRARLDVLNDEVRQCRACELCEGRTNTVFARGDGSSGVAFVGEGPGADEDAQGLPFVGAAGQLLDKMIGAMGLDREQVYICNIVKCRPPKNRKPSDEEMATCRHFLVSQLELVQPRVIVAMGATAVEGLLGLKLGITRLRGTWRLYKGTTPVMPTFHPAYLLRQPDAKREVWEDLQAVLTRLNMPVPQRRR